MDGALDWDPELHIEPLTPPRERGVIRRVEVAAQEGQNRPEEPLRLAQRQSEDEPERQRGLDRQIGEPPLPARPTGRRRFPRIRGVGREPHGHVAALDERTLILRPIPDVILGLVLRMDPRRH